MMTEKNSFAERFRPSNSGEIGCYFGVLALIIWAILIFSEGKGSLFSFVALGSLFTFNIVRDWIRDHLSYRETALEISIIIFLILAFTGFTEIFNNVAKLNNFPSWFIVAGRLSILGVFLACNYFANRFVRNLNLFTETSNNEMETN